MRVKFADPRWRSSFFSASLFEEIVDVLPHLIADASRADEKSNKPFETRQRRLVELSTQVGLDIGNSEI